MARRRSRKWIGSLFWIVVGGGLIAGAGLLASRPTDAESCSERAEARRAAGDYDGALDEYDRALAVLPTEGSANRRRRLELLTRRGEINLLRGRARHALEDFQAAQALDPNDPLAWDRVGRARLALEDYSLAAVHFEQAAKEAERLFPDRREWFLFAAGCAHYRESRVLLREGSELLEPRARAGRRDELVRALERFASNAVDPPPRAQIEAELLDGTTDGSATDEAFERLLAARAMFDRADQALSGFDTSDNLEPAYGCVRAEMHLQAGRFYELRRLTELLLQLPAARESEEFALLQTTLANGLHALALPAEAVTSFLALRKTQADLAANASTDAERRRYSDGATRTWLIAIETRLRLRQGKQARQLMANMAAPAPNNLLLNFFTGYADFLLGQRERALPALETAAQLVVTGNGRHWQLRTPELTRFVLESLVESLGSLDRPELAASLVPFALPLLPDPAPLLARRIELLRPLRDRLPTVVADEFKLLELARDGGRNLARWEQDWTKLRPKSPPHEQVVAAQAERVRRVFGANDGAFDPALRQLAQMALGDRKVKVLPPGTLKTAASALLGELRREPCLALQVYRALIAAGERQQGYLLLYGLVAEYPAIADFRLLLARHDLADGRLADAAYAIEPLLESHPDDAEIALLALDAARGRGDDTTARRIEARALAGGATPLARMVAAVTAFHRDQPLIALAAAEGADLATPEGRALAGVAALVLASRGELDAAEERATQVLAGDPSERHALEALLVALARRAGSEGAAACDRVVAEREGQLVLLGEETLIELARATFDAGAFAAAERLARAALQRAPLHADAEFALADALFAQGRYDEIDTLLAAPRPGPTQLARSRRVALMRGARDGAQAAWSWLRERIAGGEREADHSRWLALTGCAAGHAQQGLDALVRHQWIVSEEDQRFLALAVAAHDAPLSDKLPFATIVEQVAALRARKSSGDRELERFVSLDLASPSHRFVEELCELLLLHDFPELAVVRRTREARLQERYPGLGTLARARADELDHQGHGAAAGALLVAQLRFDPGDVDSLRHLLPFVRTLVAPDVEYLQGSAAAQGLTEGERQLLDARSAELAGDAARASDLLLSASAEAAIRPLALLALAEIGATDSGSAGNGLPRAPWCDAAELARQSGDDGALYAAVVAVAHDASADERLRARLARRLESESTTIPPPLARELALNLVAQPGPWFAAYDVVTDELLRAAPDRNALLRVADSLEVAVAQHGDGRLPFDAISSLARLALLARRTGVTERAAPWLERAERDCPVHPLVLAERGFEAAERGDRIGAQRTFELALRFGNREPDVLLWLAERELLVHGLALPALEHATLALAAAPRDPAQRARAQEVIARCSFLLGSTDRAQAAWEAACRERGEDPRFSVEIALESVARRGPAASQQRLAAIGASDSPHAALARRLLEIAKARPAPSN
ncbi:MAG: hypothetical protein JNL90_13390 [Planctomycetes bacterium]|nr:hypothetical protein [Planctomycetota bacterium]